MKISILYVRISSISQRSDRQKVSKNDFDKVIEDSCSGSIPFFERPGGRELKKMIDKNLVKSISFWQIDRCGRDLHGILDFLRFTSERKLQVHFIEQNLSILNEEGEENPIAKMIISILGVVAEMERKMIKERQREGIELAKLQNRYTGRKKFSREDPLQFLSKVKNKKAVELLKKGYKKVEVASITNLHVNTITKISKIMAAMN
uniref:recombinase family protein n=1 Tax=uncultured Draconibacterium sp. TaxID=1573823 RepID=UPI003216DAB6